ncbi:hypothetical protein Adeg_2170 (plasmid) [Ammonifex degensii KC4]|uniref:Uncharacterized protein n=1 Tax=Ammonifex degensii (strain DSM 10501 / KC4) TaxID=429009 RepID=C9RDH6_AMMDK|nr:hypothetical protein [Ammonifex degensii]ACX53247.1 hypothetical protein Adeg_2170 [Ammonifex degensii KC4]
MNWGSVKRFGYACWEGAKEVARGYDPRTWGTWDQKEAAINVAKDYALNKAARYHELVKAGAAVGKVGRFASKVIPGVGVVSLGIDVATFIRGAVRGWQAYGVNHR